MIKIQEGSVVVFQTKPKPGEESESKKGTLIQSMNGTAWVLDVQGFMHILKLNEVYADQGE